MSDEMETDDFQAKTLAFLSWLSDIGVKRNPKMVLESMEDGRGGRRIGKTSSLLLLHKYLLSSPCVHADCIFLEDSLISGKVPNALLQPC